MVKTLINLADINDRNGCGSCTGVEMPMLLKLEAVQNGK